jgi:glutamate 5-kinase
MFQDDPNAQPILDVEDFAHLNADTKTKGTQWGTGGMATKLTAGRIAVASGCTMVSCSCVSLCTKIVSFTLKHKLTAGRVAVASGCTMVSCSCVNLCTKIVLFTLKHKSQQDASLLPLAAPWKL